MVFLRPNLLKRSCIIKIGGGGANLFNARVRTSKGGREDLKCGELTKNQPNSMMRFKSKGAFSRKSAKLYKPKPYFEICVNVQEYAQN